jgi:hypothetical protein
MAGLRLLLGLIQHRSHGVKTTALGILTILTAVARAAAEFLKTGACDYGAAVTEITIGVALIKAADSKPQP